MNKILGGLIFSLLLSANLNAIEHYGYPGITAQKDGKWVGSDHLLNLPSSILLDVVVSKADNVDVPVAEDTIRQIAEKEFAAAGIDTKGVTTEGKPPLPFFQILVIIYKIPEGYAFSLDGRLFEEVQLPRVKLSPGVTMQAITWNTDSIHVASTQKLDSELTTSVQDLVKSFIEKYKFFQDLKKKN